jgi:hypothetical protein
MHGPVAQFLPVGKLGADFLDHWPATFKTDSKEKPFGVGRQVFTCLRTSRHQSGYSMFLSKDLGLSQPRVDVISPEEPLRYCQNCNQAAPKKFNSFAFHIFVNHSF